MIYAACIYGVLTIFVYFRQSSLIYYPNIPGRNLDATPERIGLTYRDVELITEDNIKLHGWFIPNNMAKGAVLFFHGNAGNISHRLESINIFPALFWLYTAGMTTSSLSMKVVKFSMLHLKPNSFWKSVAGITMAS